MTSFQGGAFGDSHAHLQRNRKHATFYTWFLEHVRSEVTWNRNVSRYLFVCRIKLPGMMHPEHQTTITTPTDKMPVPSVSDACYGAIGGVIPFGQPLYAWLSGQAPRPSDTQPLYPWNAVISIDAMVSYIFVTQLGYMMVQRLMLPLFFKNQFLGEL